MKPTEMAVVDKKPKLTKKTIVLIGVLLVVILVIFFSAFIPAKATTNSVSYSTEIEDKVENLLSNIKGVGKVCVCVSVDGTGEEILAKNIETKIENGVKSTIETIIMVSGKPYVVKVLTPKITSVTIVCKGADSIEVKLAIVDCVTNALSISSECVKILKMK